MRHAKNANATKSGPGRYHQPGKGHKYIPRDVEVSLMHSVFVSRIRLALMQGTTLTSRERESVRMQIVRNGGRA